MKKRSGNRKVTAIVNRLSALESWAADLVVWAATLGLRVAHLEWRLKSRWGPENPLIDQQMWSVTRQQELQAVLARCGVGQGLQNSEPQPCAAMTDLSQLIVPQQLTVPKNVDT